MSHLLTTTSIIRKCTAFILVCCIFLFPALVQATTNNSLTLQWAPNQESDLAGYRVYHGTTPGNYGNSLDVGKTTFYKFANLEFNKTHYFSVTAYDELGNESSPSVEVFQPITAPDSLLSVSVSGEGTITSNPTGIVCSSGACSKTFPQGSNVTLSAAPSNGNTFSGWSGSCSGTGSCSLTLGTSASVTATFAKIITQSSSMKPPTLVSPAPGSTLSTSGMTLQWSPGNSEFEYFLGVGTSPTAVATSPWGNIFAQKTGDKTSQWISGIPLTGKPISVRLWYRVAKSGNPWFFTDFTYQTPGVK